MDKASQNNPVNNKRFFELYGQCQTRILSFLFVMVHNEADAEDLLQDTAATMLEKFDTYEEGKNFTAWAITIAKNKAINFLKKNAKSRPYLNNDVYNRILELELREDEQISDRADALDQCLKKLNIADQEILRMRYFKEYSMKKIAEILGRSKTGLYHSMTRIHNLLYRCVKRTMTIEQL